MPAETPAIPQALQELAASKDIQTWLSDLDYSSHIVDWLAENDIPKWQARLFLKIISPVIICLGSQTAKLMTDVAKQKALSWISKSTWGARIIEKLTELSTKKSQEITALHALQARLNERADRTASDIEHRKDLSIELQVQLNQIDKLDAMQQELQFITHLLNRQPPFRPLLSTENDRDKFIYRSQYIPFAGRETELEQLTTFLHGNTLFSWQTVLGPGGVGKSRLALEFCQRNGGAWRAGILRGKEFDFNQWRPNQPTLIVMDYGFDNPGYVLKTLQDLSCNGPEYEYAVRVLILDRLTSDSRFTDVQNDIDVGRTMHAAPIVLQEANAEIAQSIFTFFHTQAQKPIPASWSKDLEHLRTIDKKMRPLFAAYYADAMVSANSPRALNRTSLLLDVIQREENKYWKPYDVSAPDKALLALATIVGGVIPRMDKAIPADLVTPCSAIAQSPERFKAIGGTVVTSQGNDGAQDQLPMIPAWEPDLVGELFVLELLADNAVTGATSPIRQAILHSAWTMIPQNTAAFLDRTRQDYFDHAAFAHMLRPPQQNKAAATWWCQLAVNLIIAYLKSGDMPKAATTYADIPAVLAEYGTAEIALSKAKAAFNFIIAYLKSGDMPKAEATYADITAVLAHYGTAEIALEKAKAAVNLISAFGDSGDMPKAEATYADITDLLAHYGTAEIAFAKAKAAFNLIVAYGNSGDMPKAEAAYADITAVIAEHGTAEIALEKARAAFNLIIDYGNNGDMPKAEATYADFTDLLAEYGSAEIALEKVKAAANLIIDYGKSGDMPKAEAAYADITDLLAEHGSAEIALEKARAAVSLIVAYGKSGDMPKAAATYADITDLLAEHGTAEIALRKAKAAVNIINAFGDSGDIHKADAAYADITDLLAHYGSAEIALRKAKAAVNIIVAYGKSGDMPNAEAAYADITAMLEEYGSAEIDLEKAKAAFNLIVAYGNSGDMPKAEAAYADITDLLAEYGSAEIALEKAKAAFNLIFYYSNSGDMPKVEAKHTDIAKLIKGYDNAEIVHIHALIGALLNKLRQLGPPE